MHVSYSSETGSPLVGYILMLLVVLVLSAILWLSFWVIFKKAGKPGWAAFVPVYNSYVLSEIIFGNGLFCLLLFIPYLNIVFSAIFTFKLASVFNRSNLFALGLIFLGPIFYPMLAFSAKSYYSGPSMTSGTFVSGGQVSSNYGEKYYNKQRNNSYSTDSYYGEQNNEFYGENNGNVNPFNNNYYGQNNGVNGNNSYNSQNSFDNNPFANDYNIQNNSNENPFNNDYYNQNNNRF